MKLGFNKLIAKQLEWPPSAPQFAGLCRLSAEDFDIPDIRKASDSIQRFSRDRGAPISAFEYTLYRSMNREFYRMRRMDSEAYFKEFKHFYDALVEKMIAGEPLIEPPELLEEAKPTSKPLDREKVRAIISEAYEMLEGDD